MTIRRLAAGDEGVVSALATYRALTDDETRELLTDDDTTLLVAFDGGEPVGFVLAYVVRRRHGDGRQIFVYEVDVAPAHRRRGVGTALMRELEAFALASGIRRGFVLTDRENVPAMRLYRTVGGRDEGDNVLWDFEYARR